MSLRAALFKDHKAESIPSSLGLAVRLWETSGEISRMFIEFNDNEMKALGPVPATTLSEQVSEWDRCTQESRRAHLALREQANHLADQHGFASAADRYIDYHSTTGNEEEIERMQRVDKMERQYWRREAIGKDTWKNQSEQELQLLRQELEPLRQSQSNPDLSLPTGAEYFPTLPPDDATRFMVLRTSVINDDLQFLGI